jgi:hypothetical protein
MASRTSSTILSVCVVSVWNVSVWSRMNLFLGVANAARQNYLFAENFNEVK